MLQQAEIERKLAAARTQLILDQPFLGALVLRLPMHSADPQWCPTSATDARQFYYNPAYIEKLSLAQVQFVLAHEALHCALSHFARRQHRNQFRWNMACDHAINPLLKQEGLIPPSGVWIEDSYLGLTAEAIYPMIDVNHSDEPMDRHLYEGEASQFEGEQGAQANDQSHSHTDTAGTASGENETNMGGDVQNTAFNLSYPSTLSQPSPLSETEKHDLDVKWQQRLAGAAQQALQAGKLSAAMTRLVDRILQPQLPWRSVLARYLSMTARDDYSYSRPSRREGSAIFPSLRSAELDVVVALDTSGSISDSDIAACLNEIAAIKGQIRARVTLYACDAQLSADSPWVFEPWEDFILPSTFKGGGGTSFKPVFDALDQQGCRPHVLIYFTDGNGDFPQHPPIFPVLWLIKGQAKVPWGERVQLN